MRGFVFGVCLCTYVYCYRYLAYFTGYFKYINITNMFYTVIRTFILKQDRKRKRAISFINTDHQDN